MAQANDTAVHPSATRLTVTFVAWLALSFAVAPLGGFFLLNL